MIPDPAPEDLERLASFVYERCGITPQRGVRKLSAMALTARIRALGLPSPAAYVRYLRSDPAGAEATSLLNAVTTNHTSFFREPAHFEWLRTHVPPAPGRRLEVWCAASATGEEPVSIAVTLLEAGHHDFRVLASDLSTAAVAVARDGVYRLDTVAHLPTDLLRRHFERGLGPSTGWARVAAHVSEHLEFRPLNLVRLAPLGRTFDVVFCRNVLIYFDQASRQRAVAGIVEHLRPGGLLFVAHTERLTGVDHSLTAVAPAIYRKPA